MYFTENILSTTSKEYTENELLLFIWQCLYLSYFQVCLTIQYHFLKDVLVRLRLLTHPPALLAHQSWFEEKCPLCFCEDWLYFQLSGSLELEVNLVAGRRAAAAK